MKNYSVDVDGKETSISIGFRILSDPRKTFSKLPKILFISEALSKDCVKYLKASFDGTKFIPVEDGEPVKSIEGYHKIVSEMLSNDVKNDDLVGYAGGGTLGDVVGFAAATFKRGVELISIPTTFLSQIDSSLGGKNAVNFMGTKNLLGTFYLPSQVFSDLYFLEKMPRRVFMNGLGELLKYYILNPGEFNWSLFGDDISDIMGNVEALEEVVYTCSKLKMDYVSRDFHDVNGIRRMLNFGHTMGHALESASGFGISHGEGVFWGMLIESLLVQSIGINSSRIISLLKPFMPMFETSMELARNNFSSLYSYVRNDKKVTGNEIRLPFPLDPGSAGSISIPLESIRTFLEERSMDELIE